MGVIKLFIQNYLSSCWKGYLNCPKFGVIKGKRNKLQKLFSAGEEKLEMELNLVKIIKNLKKMRFITKNMLLDRKTELLINHNPKTVINLDSSDMSENSDDKMSDLSEQNDFRVQHVFKEFK